MDEWANGRMDEWTNDTNGWRSFLTEAHIGAAVSIICAERPSNYEIIAQRKNKFKFCLPFQMQV